MRLKLTKPVVFFDLETTHKEIKLARIVQISLIKLFPDGRREKLKRLVNPGIPIPAESTAVHGITDEMVANEPTFKQISKSLLAIIQGMMLGGYNLQMYDIPVLSMEFSRSDINWPSVDEKLESIDAGNIFKKFHPRTLTAAVKLYLGKDFEEAHDAEYDNDATIDVFLAQLEAHPELSDDPSELAESTRMIANSCDVGGCFITDENGDYLYNFGGKKGTKVKDDNASFAQWMLDKDFSANSKAWARKIINEVSNN